MRTPATRARPVPPLIHARPRRHAENLERLREEQSQIGAADEALEQRGREEHQRREELRRETQRLKAVEGTLGPEQQTVARSLEQQRMLLTEREHGESSELDPANRPPLHGHPTDARLSMRFPRLRTMRSLSAEPAAERAQAERASQGRVDVQDMAWARV